MQIDFLTLADAANNGPDGKLNVLGLGARVLTYGSLPATSPLVVLAAASAGVEEAGEYAVAVAIVEPDGTRELLVESMGRVNAEVVDARVPTGIGVVLNLFRPFRLEGVHRFEVRFGELTQTYEFLVRLATAGQAAEEREPTAAA